MGILPDATTESLLGQFLDDDEIGAVLNRRWPTAWETGRRRSSTWRDITETLPITATPDNGPAPTSLPPVVWGQEKEVVLMSRFHQTFAFADSNAADWYYESSGYSVTSSPGVCVATVCTVGNVGATCAEDGDCAQSISLDSKRPIHRTRSPGYHQLGRGRQHSISRSYPSAAVTA